MHTGRHVISSDVIIKLHSHFLFELIKLIYYYNVFNILNVILEILAIILNILHVINISTIFINYYILLSNYNIIQECNNYKK